LHSFSELPIAARLGIALRVLVQVCNKSWKGSLVQICNH